jgi:hypothetical protein
MEHQLKLLCLSIGTYTSNSKTAEWNLIKVNTGEFCEKLLWHSLQLWLKSDKNKGYFACKPACNFACISSIT